MFRIIIACIIASLTLAISAAAQIATTTSLVGTVTDPTERVIAGAVVTAVNTGTRDTYSTVTNEQGYFAIRFVRVGAYEISVAHPGFQAARRTGVQVDINQIVRTDITLQVGSVAESVNVEAAAPAIKTDDASVSEIINERAVADLPLNGRDPLKLAITTPGVIQGMKPTNGVPPGQDFIGAGTREIQNSISLDGISILNNLITTTSMRPSVDSVQEVQVQTGTYSAQYGSYMGVQINLITKSGTNALHGTAAHFLRNDKLDSRNFFEDPRNPKRPLRQNQFGFELDGPVVIPGLYNGRDRTFFMVSYEGLRQKRQSTSLATVLTDRMRGGDFSEVSAAIRNPAEPGTSFAGNVIPQSQLSPVSQRVLEYIPRPNRPGLTSNYLATFPNDNTTDQTVDRIDQTIGSSVRLFFRYAWQDTTYIAGAANPTSGSTSPVTNKNLTFGYTHTLSPRLVNDFRFGRMRVDTNSVNYFYVNGLTDSGANLGIPGFDGDVRFDNPGVPDINITGFTGAGNGGTNWFQDDTTWQASEQLSYMVGSHNFMAGAEFRKFNTGRSAVNSPRGIFNFNGQITGYAPADFITGFPQSVTTPGPQVPGRVAQWRDAFYFLDNWQVSRRLTVNVGLRYELPTVPYTVTGFATKLNPEQTEIIPANPPVPGFEFLDPVRKNFAPRLGFAYRITDNTVARGGFGIYYNPNQMNSFTFLNTNPPFTPVVTYTSAPANPTLTFLNPTPSGSARAAAPPNVITIGPELPTPRMHQWSFSLERQLWPSAGLELQYLGSHQLHLDRSYFNNTPLPGPGVVNDRRPNPRFTVIRTIQNDLISNYEGLSVILRQRMARGLQVLAGYTWSKTLDVTTDSNGGGAPMDPYNWRADYGNASWDLRHRFVASYNYELPFFRQSAPALRTVLGGWQLNGITILQSGFPVNVTIGTDVANTGVGNQRPNLVSEPKADCGSGRLSNCITASSFAAPAQYTYGNAGRNLVRGPKRYTTDLSVFKNFSLAERARLQFRAEAFNVFNTPIFSNPQSVFGTQAFGTVSSTALDNREIQLALKLSF